MNSHMSMADSCNFGKNGCPSVNDDSQIDQQHEANTNNRTKSQQHPADESVKLDTTRTSQTKSMTQSVQQIIVPVECIVVFDDRSVPLTQTKDKQKSERVAPLNVKPPANFYTQRRDIAEEQQKILASMQKQDSA